MRPSINDLMKRAAAGSYDEKFKKEMSNNIFDKYSQRESFDFDLTNQDYLKGDENPYTYNMGLNENAEDPFNEIRANNQSGVEQLGLGLVRATNKAATEVAKLAPIIYGVGKAIFEDNETSALEDIFNNEGIKALDEMNQKINTDYLPVYIKDSVKNGTLIDNLLSTSFYATEGADGIGFMASMFFPGMILEKFALGSKLVYGLSKVSKLTKMVEGTEGSVQVLKGLGWSGRAIDSKIAVLVNSMIESGAESKGTQDALNSEKLNEIELYKSKGLSQEQAEEVFNQKHPDWDNQVASAMKGDFWMQMPMLLGTGSMMHKAIFGKALDKVEKTVEYGLKGRVGSMAKQWGKATLSEGFIEEAGQSTLENYYTKKAYEGKLGKGLIGDVNIGDLTKEYINTVSSVEGQKAIFLGALMGGPFMSMEARKEHLKGLKDTNSITNGVKSSIDDYNIIKENDIYEKDPKDPTKPLFKRDENGNITNEKVVNREKALEVAKSLKNIEDDDALYDEAIKSDDVELQKFIQNRNILKLIAPAIQNGKLGLQILKEELEQTLKFTDISEADKNSKDENNTNKKLVETILVKAEHLQKQNEKFKDFSPDIIKLDDPRTTKELNEEYLNHLNSKYIETKSLQYDAENNLKELNKKRNNILDELGLDKDLQIEDEVATKKEESSSLLKQVSDKIRETEKEVNKYKKDINELWENKDLINKSFESYINNKEKSQKQTSEENVQKADELELKINQALTDIGDISNSIELQNYEKNIPEELKPFVKQRINERKLEVNEIEKEDVDRLNEEFNKENETLETLDLEKNETLHTDVSDVENHEQTTEVDTKAEVTNSESQNNSYKKLHYNNYRIISKEEETGKPLSYVNKEWIDYENTPVNKKGIELHFSLNENPGNNKNLNLALQLFKDILSGKKSVQSIVDKSKSKSLDELREFLVNYTPLNIGFKDSQTKGLLDNLNGNPGKDEIFNKYDKPTRLKIINHILDGGKLEDITTTIIGQMPGVLQIEDSVDGLVPESKVTNLNYFQINNLVDDEGNLTNKGYHDIQSRLHVVIDNNNLQNAIGEIIPLTTKDGSVRRKGEFYLRIPKANGEDFYLKLNTTKISEVKANVIYEIQKYRFTPEGVINKGLTLNEVSKTNPELVELIKTDLEQEYNVVAKIKPQSDITLKDIIDIVIHDNNNSEYIKFNFKGTGIEGESILQYGTNTITSLEEFENKKDEIIDWITSTKRQNIKMGAINKIGGTNINTSNKHYLDYLISNNIINTNAVTFDKEGKSLPTFGGYTNIYWKDVNIKNKVVPKTKKTAQVTNNVLKDGDIIKGYNSNGEVVETITLKSYNGVVKLSGQPFKTSDEIIKFLNESLANFDKLNYKFENTQENIRKSENNLPSVVKENLNINNELQKLDFLKNNLSTDFKNISDIKKSYYSHYNKKQFEQDEKDDIDHVKGAITYDDFQKIISDYQLDIVLTKKLFSNLDTTSELRRNIINSAIVKIEKEYNNKIINSEIDAYTPKTYNLNNAPEISDEFLNTVIDFKSTGIKNITSIKLMEIGEETDWGIEGKVNVFGENGQAFIDVLLKSVENFGVIREKYKEIVSPLIKEYSENKEHARLSEVSNRKYSRASKETVEKYEKATKLSGKNMMNASDNFKDGVDNLFNLILDNQNNSNNIRISENNSVSLSNNIQFTHQIEGSEENKQVKYMQNKGKESNLNITDAQYEELMIDESILPLIMNHFEAKGEKIPTDNNELLSVVKEIINENRGKLSQQIDKVCNK